MLLLLRMFYKILSGKGPDADSAINDLNAKLRIMSPNRDVIGTQLVQAINQVNGETYFVITATTNIANPNRIDQYSLEILDLSPNKAGIIRDLNENHHIMTVLDLRRTYQSELLRRGVDPERVKMLNATLYEHGCCMLGSPGYQISK